MPPLTLFAACLALHGPAGGLRWEAPATGCPSEAEVAARLTELVGEGELGVAADARASATARGWTLDLEIRWGDAAERRHLEGATCEELAEAALVLVAVLAEEARADPTATDAEPQPEPPQPEPLTAAESAPRGPSEVVEEAAIEAGPDPEVGGIAPPPSRRGPPPRRRALALTTGALADIGGLGRPSFGVRLGLVGWLGRRLRLVAEGRYLPPRATGSDAAYARAGRIQLGYAHLAGCVNFGRGRVQAPTCGALEVGGIAAAGFGEGADQGTRDLWLAIAANTSLVVTIAPRLALVAGLEIVAPLARQRYVYGPEILYETGLPGARALFGLEFRLADQIRPEPENP